MEFILIGGSAGSFRNTSSLISSIKRNSNKCYIICLHRWKEHSGDFIRTLTLRSPIPAFEVHDKMKIQEGNLYITPSNYHTYITKERYFVLSNEEEYSFSRPSIDICFSSAANSFGEKCTGILLSGANNDGAIGLCDILNAGGKAIVQNPSECEVSVMPEAALELNSSILSLSMEGIRKHL